MTKVFVTTRDGQIRAIAAEPTRSLMETIRDSGIDEVLALCGGCCSCATCHVYVDPQFVQHLPPMSADEDGLLEGVNDRRATSRLSCQIIVAESLDGLCVTIPPED